MPLLRVNAGADGPVLHGAGNLEAEVAQAVARLAPGDPIILIVHGFKFSPASAETSPHDHIFSLTPARTCWKALSWPRHLGFGRDRDGEGLCIAFGWEARGTIWRAWSEARQAGLAMADLITMIRRHHDGPVDMVGHSLGARVCLTALRYAPPASIGRMVLMAAAEFRAAAAAAMASPAGRTAEVLNITTRENDVFDALIEWFLRAPTRGDRALGLGLPHANWLDIQIDADRTRAALDRLGFRIPAPKRRVCHWSSYLRPGLMLFYADLLRNRETLSLNRLRHALPREAEPRWARLRPHHGLFDHDDDCPVIPEPRGPGLLQ
ncbi:alpha/beta fold hydrolase [Pseudoruegeria sp. HB172150]|uniref:alpha/beta fold hydrolase n=1 Tax=Pseudoruegeria sp. HB172150 TaxID=2721164 RepID=UPI0015541033|nr:alpha/beta fold hydrolase [Pseudoruegeria sp. HB172150]